MSDYRTRIYERYAEVFKDSGQQVDLEGFERRGLAFKLHYFKGWLPEHKDAPIVDLACGSANILYTLQTMGYTRLKGVDVSPDQVELARQILPDIVESDLGPFLEQHQGAFELIIGMDIIEHFTKDEVLAFLDKCYAALKPGGRLILQTPNAASPLVSGTRYGDFTHEVCFQADVLTRLLKLCRFRDVEAREMGPVPWGYSLTSSVRYLMWQGVRAGIRMLNRIETGSPGSPVLTRVFLISARR